MNVNELTAMQTAEMLDLQDMQQQELNEMTKRHDREYAQNPTSKYFAERRLQQRNVLLIRHRIEREKLHDLHENEYKEWHKVKTIIQESNQLSFDAEPKREVKQQKEEPETRLQKLKKLWEKMRGKDLEKEK